MKSNVLIGLMFGCGILMLSVPFLCFTIASQYLQLPNITSWEVIIPMYLIVLVATFGLSIGSFAFLQYNNCKKVKGSQIATNAGIATGIQAGFMTLITIFPGLLRMVENIIPVSIPYTFKQGLMYGYYTFFASLFGTAVGGTFSTIC